MCVCIYMYIKPHRISKEQSLPPAGRPRESAPKPPVNSLSSAAASAAAPFPIPEVGPMPISMPIYSVFSWPRHH